MPGKKQKSNRQRRPRPSKRPFVLALFLLFWRGIIWVARSLIALLRKSKGKAEAMRIESERRQKSRGTSYLPIKVIESIEGRFEAFESRIAKNKSTIGIILGARGTGKSAIGMRLLENFYAKTKRKCYCIGFRKETLPLWLTVISDVNFAKKDSIILIDEGGMLYSSRESMSLPNKILSDALLIARHNDLSIIFISQNSANLEINALRQADYLLLKPSSLLQKDFERQKIKDIYGGAAQGFERHKDIVGITYVYSTEFQGFVSNGLPSFWSSGVSKAFRK